MIVNMQSEFKTFEAHAKLLAVCDISSPSNSSTISTINPLAASDKALLQRQQDVIKMQDHILLDIEKGVDGLHRQALEIKSEVTLQNQVLDDLDAHVDVATEGLKMLKV
jgi:hypothetical protein